MPSALLGPGEAMAIDYIDFVEIGDTMYVATPGVETSVPTPLRLGPLVARVRCILVGSPTYRGDPPLVDGTAAFPPVGTAIYSVVGLPSTCGLAAVVGTAAVRLLAQPPGLSTVNRAGCEVTTPAAGRP